MLPVIHPMEKTKIEVKRSIQRLELFVANNPSEEKAKQVLELMKQALEIM
jgi:hypothetical protein